MTKKTAQAQYIPCTVKI